MLDLFYKNAASSDTTLWRGEYGYDASGNRTYEKLTQRPPASGVSGSNTRSRLFAYDKLDRLLGVISGAIDTGSTEYNVAASDAYPSVRREVWNLDLMGNWSGKGGVETGPSTDPCATSTILPGPGGQTEIEPSPFGGGGASVWYATDFGHEVSFNGTPPPPSSGVSEVFE